MFCTDNSLRSPVDVQGDIPYKEFTVGEFFEHSFNSNITKISDHVFKLEGTFGYIGFNNVRFNIMSVFFRAPSEHEIGGERFPMELQIIAKNINRDHVGMSILFKLADEPNPLLSLMGFGKGILSKLDNKDYLNPQKHQIGDLALNLSPFLLNNNYWIMYQGHDLNPPCAPMTWLISFEPVPMSMKQLDDFNPLARPDYTIKTIGERSFFRNKLKDSDNQAKQLAISQDQETAKMKQLVEEKKKKEEEKKQAEVAAKKAKVEALKKLVMNYRVNKAKLKYAEPPTASQEPIITEGIMKALFTEINTFNFLHTPCKDYVKYIPEIDKTYGYVPVDAIMSWEIKNTMLENKNITIPEGSTYPSPVNSSYVYRTFYYVPKPDCHKNNPFQILAETDAEEANSTNTTQPYVPVIVESAPDFLSPDRPATTFKMAVPGKTPELQNVTIQRQFMPETVPLPQQDLALANQYNKTYGHIVVADPEKPLILIPPPPGATNSRGRVIRIWPELVTAHDGVLPEDGIFAWTGVKEGELVVNSTVPQSFNSEYRWILLMYVPCNYWVGDDKKVPLLPVYILARKDFKYTKDKLPEYIPVPRNTELTDGEIKADLISITFTAKNASQVLPNPEVLEKPVGYDGKKIYVAATGFRERAYVQKAATDPVYFNEVHSRYMNMSEGRPADLLVMEKEEITGILISPDPEYRRKQEEALKKEEQRVRDQLKREADRKARLEAIYKNPTRVTQMKRVCVEWILEIVLNDRFNFKDKDKETMDQRNCIKWEWKEITDDNSLYQPPTADSNNSTKNTTNSTSNPEEEKKKKEEERLKQLEAIKKKVIQEIEDYCLNKLHVVLNDRQFESKDEHYELCKKTIDQLRRTRVKVFMRSLGPALQLLKEQTEKNADRIARAQKHINAAVSKQAQKVKDAGKAVSDALDKSKRMQPINATAPQLARITPKRKKKEEGGLLNKLAAATRRLWNRA